MTFKIAVFVKQVPDTNEIKWTAENTIQREGLDSIINPFDIGAVSMALNFKKLIEKQGENVEITAVTMGPNQAIDVLQTAIVYGCDNGVLLSDKKFSGADTLATAYTLSQFIKKCMPDFKLILCGQQAIDGDTAQTPSSLAEKLGIAQITNVISLKEANNAYAVVTKETSAVKKELKSGYPLLIATTLKAPYIKAEINDYIRAQNTEITALNAAEIEAETDKIGFKGSPTQVRKSFRDEIKRNTELLENLSTGDFSDFILNEIDKCRLNND